MVATAGPPAACPAAAEGPEPRTALVRTRPAGLTGSMRSGGPPPQAGRPAAEPPRCHIVSLITTTMSHRVGAHRRRADAGAPCRTEVNAEPRRPAATAPDLGPPLLADRPYRYPRTACASPSTAATSTPGALRRRNRWLSPPPSAPPRGPRRAGPRRDPCRRTSRRAACRPAGRHPASSTPGPAARRSSPGRPNR